MFKQTFDRRVNLTSEQIERADQMATLDYIFEEIAQKTTKLLESNYELREYLEEDPELQKFIGNNRGFE